MIKLKEITKYYHSDSSVTLALKNINLEFKKGEFVAITGKSGSGKSTLINLISGMDTYEEGEMYFRGMETSYYDDNDWELYRRNNISFIYQSYNLIDSYTALQNVETVMMLCENDDNRRTKKERRKRAMEMLKKVGLEKQAHNRASHMSSGQKQRLGIARALAKETDVIVADEPTGNLDVENGQAIMAILHELAKEDKLVLVVTHNYDQAEPYVTRKIRLFDGEIVEDEKIDEEMYENMDFQSDFDKEEVHEEPDTKHTFSIARRFVKMNRFAQPHRILFLFSFMLVSAIAMLIFVGNFIANMDDYKTRTTYTEVFSNIEDDRLLVKRTDGKAMSDDDVRKISDISYVAAVEKYDDANDWNYYAEENVDYLKEYTLNFTKKAITIKALNKTHFIKSSSGLQTSDLRKGRLPESMYEVVIYDKDDDKLNEMMEIYTANNHWSANFYRGNEFKIVGLLKSDDNQIYFSEEFCKSCDYGSEDYELEYNYKLNETYDYTRDDVEDTISDKEKKAITKLYIDESLKDNEAILPNSVIDILNYEGEQKDDSIFYRTLYEDGLIKKIYDKYDEEKQQSYELVFKNDVGNLGPNGLIGVSKEKYYELMGENDMSQMGVFITDYAYTDDVINKLNDYGYEAISVFRVCTSDYDDDLVTERLMNLVASAGIVLVIFVLNILVIYLIMKLKKGDFIILKSLGMKQKMADEINYYELISMMLVADIVAIIGANICGNFKVPYISELIKYYRVQHYAVILGISILMASITAKVFNRFLKKKFM